MNNLLPVYRHPALTVLVDDSRSFLDSIAFRLDRKMAHKAFDDAPAALDWLHQAGWQPMRNANEIIQVGYDGKTGNFKRRNASIDLDPIFRTVAERERFEMPAVLVVDYAMPGINGLEFCEAVAHLPCRKILLTGQASEKTAIDAFNRKLIDCFISKSDPEAMNQLEAAIGKSHRDYFNRQTSTLKDLLARHSYAFLADPAVAELVEQLYSRYRFVEHYLFPNPEGILFFDAQGNGTLMVMTTPEILISQFEIAQHENAPPALLSALKEFRLVPFFSDNGGFYREEIGDDWLQYCLPPQVCEGRETYYWALFDLPRHYLKKPVYSYAEYLQQAAGNPPLP